MRGKVASPTTVGDFTAQPKSTTVHTLSSPDRHVHIVQEEGFLASQTERPLLSIPGWYSMWCHLVLLVIFTPWNAALDHYQGSPLFTAWCVLEGLSVILVLALLFTPRLPLSHAAEVILVIILPKAVLLSCVLCSLLHAASVALYATPHIGLAYSIVPPLLAVCLKVPTWLVCLVVTLSLSTVTVSLVYFGAQNNPSPSFELDGITVYAELVCWVYVAALMLALLVSKILELENNLNRMSMEALEQLTKANTKLQEECQRGQDITNTLVHEIRTPLQSLLGGAEVLMGGKLSKIQKSLLRNIGLCGSQITSKIHSVLEARRLGNGKVELFFSQFRVQDLLHHSCCMVKHLAVNKGVLLDWDVNPQTQSDCLLEGDHGLLSQVMVHLLSNAIKLSPEGETVHMRANVSADFDLLTAGEAPHQVGRLTIDVINSGPGMALEAHRMFQRFAQADNNTSAKFNGSNLGLWISQKIIVDCMGGRLGTDRVCTAPGRGTVVQVDVPLKVFPSQAGKCGSLSIPGVADRHGNPASPSLEVGSVRSEYSVSSLPVSTSLRSPECPFAFSSLLSLS